MNNTELKKASGLLKQLDTLDKRYQNLNNKKNKLSSEEYTQLSSEYKEEMKTIKKEITSFKKECVQNLSETQKNITSLKRKKTGLKKKIEKISAEMETEGIDKKGLSAKLKEFQKEMKSLQKELSSQLGEEALLIQTSEILSEKKDDEKTESDSKDSDILITLKSNPVYLGGAIGVIVIILAVFIFISLQGNRHAITYDTALPTEETTQEPPAEDVSEQMDKSGVITGSNVNLRQEPNITSAIIKQLQNGAKVTISEKKTVNKSDDAVLSQTVQITTDNGKKIKLAAGKGVIVLEEKENTLLVSYAIEDGKSIKGTVPKTAVQRISGDIWYKVKNKDGVIGWMYGKYVSIN